MRNVLLPTLAALAAFCVLISLGNWQMRRLAWKEGLTVSVEARVGRAPLDLAALRPRGAADQEYTPVRARGHFLHEREMHVYTVLGSPKGRFSGPGYWVVTPLAREDGGHVLVNRGFVPLDRKDPATRREGQVAGPVTVEGLLRAPDERNLFTPDDNQASNIWFARDPVRMGEALRLGAIPPFFIDAFAAAPDGLPQGGETRLDFANRHREYAYTWYALAGALLLVYSGAVWTWARRGRPVGGSVGLAER